MNEEGMTHTEYLFLRQAQGENHSAHLDNPHMAMHLLERGWIQFQLAMGSGEFMDGHVDGLSFKGRKAMKSYEGYLASIAL